MRRLWLTLCVLLPLALQLAACGKQGSGSGEAASPPPTTNPMGQPVSPDTPSGAAEERKASGY